MARILYGGGVTDIRGSIAGTTFSRNAAGPYARARVTPTNPGTQSQGAQRARLESISSAWGLLTIPQRESWIAFAELHNPTRLAAGKGPLTGQQWFMSLNMNLLSIYPYGPGTLLETAPLVSGRVEIQNLEIGIEAEQVAEDEALFAIASAGFTVEQILNPGDPTFRFLILQIRATPVMSGGRQRPRSATSAMRNVHVVELTDVDPQTVNPMLADYVGTFGDTLTIDPSRWTQADGRLALWSEARLVNATTGWATEWQAGRGAVVLDLVEE